MPICISSCPTAAQIIAPALQSIGFKGQLVAVTLGREGAWYQAGDRCGQVPSPHVQVVETTGAGDAFIAALLDSLLAARSEYRGLDDDLETVILRACAAGALTATGYGAIPSLPDSASIDALLRMVQIGNGAAPVTSC